ncbi:MAG: glycosyltransferase [Methanobacterium sp.]
MGKALRTGFEKAEGDVIVTLDADLSYEPQYITELIRCSSTNITWIL